MAHQPTKEQLDNDLPKLVGKLTDLLDEYKTKTGADNRFIRMVLGGLRVLLQKIPKLPLVPEIILMRVSPLQGFAVFLRSPLLLWPHAHQDIM